MRQKILKFNFKFKSSDFFVTEKNYFAYNLIKQWPKWTNQLVYIYGPQKCGKTFISQIWKEISNAIFVSRKNFKEKIPNNLDINYVKNNNWILDDVDKLIEENYEINSQKILNLINILKVNPNSFLLMTGQKSPKYNSCKLKDLTSRMLSAIVIEVGYPDQKLLIKIIEKYLSDRNIILSDKCLLYISNRIERSYESALKIAKKIDFISLEKKSNITVYFLRSLLET